MDYHIDWGVPNSTLWTCKPNSPCNDTHSSIAGKSEGRKPKGGGGDKGGVAIRLAVVVRVAAARAIREEKERRTGADVGRRAQRHPLRKKKPSGTPVTLPWLSFDRES